MAEDRTYHPEFDDAVWESILDGLLGCTEGKEEGLARIPPEFRQRMRRIANDWMDLARYVQKQRGESSGEYSYHEEVDDLSWEEVQDAFFAALKGQYKRGHIPPGHLWRLRRIASDWLTVAHHLQQQVKPMPTPDIPTITEPGIFEGQPYYTPYFWEAVLQGSLEPDRDGIYELEVEEEDAQKFPELQVGQKVLLRRAEDGFIHTRLVPSV